MLVLLFDSFVALAGSLAQTFDISDFDFAPRPFLSGGLHDIEGF